MLTLVPFFPTLFNFFSRTPKNVLVRTHGGTHTPGWELHLYMDQFMRYSFTIPHVSVWDVASSIVIYSECRRDLEMLE